MNNNFFTITRLGQLRNVQGFIKQMDAKNNILMVMHTPNDIDLIENLEKNINYKLFKKVLKFELPNRPLGVTVKKCKNLYEFLISTMSTLHQQYHFQNIILCNTDNYYKYFEYFAKDHNIDLILLEEGLTTYRMFTKDIEKAFNFRDIKFALKRVFKNLKKFIISIVVLILKLLSWIFRVNIFNFIKHHRIPKKYRYGNIEYFKEAYVCFPSKMENLTTKDKIGDIKKLNFFLNKNIKEKTVNKLEENMTLFVNQRYVPYDLHFNIIFEIFEKKNIKDFFIKFHPKESKNMYWPHLIKAMEKYPNLNVKILEDMDHVPAEDLMNTGKITRIIGITTTTLIYSKLIDPNIEVLSIADGYRRLCLSKKYNVDARKMDLFERDYKAFKEIFHIKQI